MSTTLNHNPGKRLQYPGKRELLSDTAAKQGHGRLEQGAIAVTALASLAAIWFGIGFPSLASDLVGHGSPQKETPLVAYIGGNAEPRSHAAPAISFNPSKPAHRHTAERAPGSVRSTLSTPATKPKPTVAPGGATQLQPETRAPKDAAEPAPARNTPPQTAATTPETGTAPQTTTAPQQTTTMGTQEPPPGTPITPSLPTVPDVSFPNLPALPAVPPPPTVGLPQTPSLPPLPAEPPQLPPIHAPPQAPQSLP